MIPGLSTAKLIGLAIAAAAILSFVLLAISWRDRMESRRKQLDTICAAARAAADAPKLACKLVAQQIGEMGNSIADLKTGIAHQNAAVNALAQQAIDAQQKARQAAVDAAQRAKQAQAASDSLSASSRAPERSSAPCAPSKALQEKWR